MRRKSGRNSSKATEEKADLSKKSTRQSSRRRKRSSSRSSEDSEEEIAHTNTKDHIQEKTQSSAEENYENESKTNVTHTDSNVNKSNKCNSDSSEKAMLRSGFYTTPMNKDAQDNQEQEGPDENEEDSKGKSNSNNKSKIEQTSNYIEPEIEHENVQGTPQSPSNDNADNENVENIKDTTNINVEGQNQPNNEDSGSKNTVDISSSEAGQENIVTDFKFESEYSKENVSQENRKHYVESVERSHEIDRSSSRKHSPEKDENSRSSKRSSNRSIQEDKCEVRGNEEKNLNDPTRKVSDYNENESNIIKSRRKSSNIEMDKEKTEERENTASKKKITLRRSPPANKDKTEKSEDGSQKERRSSVNVDSLERETDTHEDKSTKKITLKRNTLEEKSEGSEQVSGDKRRSSINDEMEKKRRLSSLSEDKTQTDEEKPKLVLKRIKLIRNFSQDSQNNEEKNKMAREQRKKWGTTDLFAKLTSTLYKIDVESIKIVCPSLEFLSESEVKLEDVPRERRKSESDALKRKISIDNKSEDSDRPDYERQTSEDSSGEQKTELNPNIIAMNRKISIVDDTASKLKPPPSPAKNPASDVLFITNLVRPFTVKQLKELLERTGEIKENGFWTDRIKSKCYVHYNSTEEAEATRNALHGVHWPIGNGKKLIIDYATIEDMEKARNPAPVPIIIPEKIPEKENREPERTVDRFKEKEKPEKEERRKREVREWDVGKEESRRRHSRSRSKSRERARKHSRRSYTPDYVNNRKIKKVEEPVPQKLMDDLFLKTKATPSIYWQPLSPEEIATKQQQRLVRMEEHKRRIEETRSRLRDSRRGSYRRR